MEHSAVLRIIAKKVFLESIKRRYRRGLHFRGRDRLEGRASALVGNRKDRARISAFFLFGIAVAGDELSALHFAVLPE